MTTRKANAKAANRRPTRFSISRKAPPYGVVTGARAGSVVAAHGGGGRRRGVDRGGGGLGRRSVVAGTSIVVSSSDGRDRRGRVGDRAVGEPLGGLLGVGSRRPSGSGRRPEPGTARPRALASLLIRPFERRWARRLCWTLLSRISSSILADVWLPEALRLRPTTLIATMPPSRTPRTPIQTRLRAMPMTTPESAMPPTALTGSIADVARGASRAVPDAASGLRAGRRCGGRARAGARRERGRGFALRLRPCGAAFGFGLALGAGRGRATAGAPIRRPPRSGASARPGDEPRPSAGCRRSRRRWARPRPS